MTRILIADQHEIVREGLRTVIEAQPNWEVVAEAADGREAMLTAIETKPDIAVLDIYLPLLDGIEVTRQLRAQLPKTEILILTMHNSETLIREAVRAGARGYIFKSDTNGALTAAIQSLMTHKPFFTAQMSEDLKRSVFVKPRKSGVNTHKPRTQCGPTDCRRTLEQRDGHCSRHKPQDCRDPSVNRHA